MAPSVFPMASGCKVPSENVNLACLVTGYNPEPVRVTWDSKAERKGEKTFPSTWNGTFYTVTSQFSFPASQWKLGPHKCSVYHEWTKSNIEKTFQKPASGKAQILPKSTVPPPGEKGSTETTRATTRNTECPSHHQPPQVYLLPPPLQDLWFRENATFTCLMVGNDLQEAHLSWEVDGKPPTSGVKEGLLDRLANGSQSQSSHLALPRSTWDKGTPVTCTLSHASLQSPKVLTSMKEHGAQAPSSLSVILLTIPVSMETASWLLCMVSGFSPTHILLMWLEDQKEVDSAWLTSASPMPQSGNMTFQTWSVLHIPATSSPSPATYTCVVGHEASRTILNASRSLNTGDLVTTTPLAPQTRDENSDDYTDLEEEGGLWTTLCTFVALFLLTLLYSGFVTFIKVK